MISKIIWVLLIAAYSCKKQVPTSTSSLCRDQIYESDCSKFKHCKYYNVDNKDNGYCVDITMSQCYLVQDIVDCGQVSTCFWNYKQGLCSNLLHSQGCNDFDLNINMCNSFNALCKYEGKRCLTLKQYENQQIERKQKIQEIRDGKVEMQTGIIKHYSLLFLIASYLCIYF